MELNGWDVAAISAKALTYAATFSASGALFFVAYAGALLREEQYSHIRRLMIISMIIAVLASCARLSLTAASMSGEMAGMFDSGFARMILGAGEGRASGARAAGLALMAVTLMLLRPRGLVLAVAIVGAGVASLSFAFIGHMQGLFPTRLPALLLCIHLLCGAFWLGALAPLLIAARGGGAAQLAALAARFGNIALGVVALLLAAGASMLWTLIGGTAQFWNSGYGRMMAVKLLVVAALLATAAVNKLYLTARLLDGQAHAVVQLRRTVCVEMVFGALILLITATFTTITGPPR